MQKIKVFLKTYGCQMNLRDSEVIVGLLTTNDYRLTANQDEADVVIFNTCSVRQHAEDKVWSEIGRIAKGKSREEKPLIGLIGCMAQNYKEAAFQRSAFVDFVVGPADIHKIPGIVRKLTTNSPACPAGRQQPTTNIFEYKIWETGSLTRPEEIYHSGFYADNAHAYVVISEGCSNFCSYCVVPYTRGALRHRKHTDILKEIKLALDKGIEKITLLGQNVNAYKDEGIDFVKLVGLVNAIKGLKEFSFITSHPKDASLGLFKAMADAEKLKKYLHLPVQSGSDQVLKLMNRGYTTKFYLELAQNYRKIVKGAVLTTDIIVGFPTESQKDFKDTYGLVKNTQFDAAFIFKYSPRPNTAALKFNDDVPKQEKEKRHALILDLQKSISKSRKRNETTKE